MPEVAQRERGVIFTPESVRAIREGRKTQTRRVVRPQPPACPDEVHPSNRVRHAAPYIDAYCGARKTEVNPRGMGEHWCWWTRDDRVGPEIGRCPYGAPGDRLYVREAWSTDSARFYPHEPVVYKADVGRIDWCLDARRECRYAAARARSRTVPFEPPERHALEGCACDFRWRSPLLMPRRLARTFLVVDAIRVERLWDLTPEDAAAEGWPVPGWEPGKPRLDLSDSEFARGWDGINGERGFPWSSNPFVWVVTFRVDRALP